MTRQVSRRAFLAVGPAVGLASVTATRAAPDRTGRFPEVGSVIAEPTGDAQPSRLVSDLYPAQPPDVVREVVGASHGNFARVKELVDRQPSLARATWDWGFGDWESALGAASHTGRREIAEYLLANGARPTLFSATMLGQLEVVRAFVAAAPGVQRTPGPHGITLLAHARFGGEPAAAVLEFLESLGDADERPATEALTDGQVAQLVGTYTFGTGAGNGIVVGTNDRNLDVRGRLTFKRGDQAARDLFHVGSNAFYPAGAVAVRIRFHLENGRVARLTVHDPGVVFTATRAD